MVGQDRFIDLLIKKLNEEISRKLKSGFLQKEYFTTTNYNGGHEAHSRIHAIIVKVCSDLKYNIEVERVFKTLEKSFRPDVAIYKSNKLFAIIEYESTNSSDNRYFDFTDKSDLKNIINHASSELMQPEYWVILTTLPKKKVTPKEWKFRYPKSIVTPDQRKKIFGSPFDYYFPIYITETENKFNELINDNQKLKTSFLNLDKDEISEDKLNAIDTPKSKICLLNLDKDRISEEYASFIYTLNLNELRIGNKKSDYQKKW